MRMNIYDVNIITGDGKTFLEGASIEIDGELISEIIRVPYPGFRKSDMRINGRGGFLIPGIINYFAHQICTGPIIGLTGQPGVSKRRVAQFLEEHLLQGTTTAINGDGLPTMEEVAEARSLTPILIQKMTGHLPSYLEGAKFLNLGGLKKEHWLTVEEMVKQGAVAIGEMGSGEEDWSQFRLFVIPQIVESMTGIRIRVEDSGALKAVLLDAQPPDEKAASDVLAKIGISSEKIKPVIKRLKETVAQRREYAKFAKEGTREGAKAARKLGLPMAFHMTTATKDEAIEYAKELGSLLIATHSNFTFKPGEAIEAAKAIKKEGGWVDILTGDALRAREYLKNNATALAMLDEGLVDIVSTDTIATYWDPILMFLEYAVQQRVVDLPQAIALATANVTKAVPKAAPNRGEIAVGKVADLVILSKDSLSDVRTVIIGGRVVVDEGRIVPSPE